MKFRYLVLIIPLLLVLFSGCTLPSGKVAVYWIILSPETATRMAGNERLKEDTGIPTILLFARPGAEQIVGISITAAGDDGDEADTYRQRLAALGIGEPHVVMVKEPAGSALIRRLDILSPDERSQDEGMAATLRLRVEVLYSTPADVLGTAVLRNIGDIVEGEVEMGRVEQFFADTSRGKTAILWMQPVVIDITDDTRYLYEQEYMYQVYQAYMREDAE